MDHATPEREGLDGRTDGCSNTANPTGTTLSHLNGVSCTAADACTAVGCYDNSSFADQPLAEVFNTGSWKVQSTPNPAGAYSSGAFGVSCTAAQACTAAGAFSESSGRELTLAQAEM